jgi:predicted porin
MLKTSMVTAVILAVSTGFAYAETKQEPTANWSVTPFGEVRAYVEGSSADNVDLEAKSTDSKVGLKAKGDLGPLFVFGELSVDADINGDGNDDITSRFGYVGIGKEGLGAISIGKQMSLQDKYIDKADIFMNGGNAGVQKMDFKQKNSVVYENSINRIKFGALAAMTDDSGNNTLDRYQVAAEFAGVGVAIGKDNIADTRWLGVGASYKIQKIGLYGSYTIKDAGSSNSISDLIVWDSNDTTSVTRGMEFAASYDLTEQLIVKGGYSVTDATADDGTVAAGVEYTAFKNLVAFSTVDYDVDASDYTARVGMSIKF